MELNYIFVFLSLFAIEIIYLKIAEFNNIKDIPSYRSSHVKTTISGGGIIYFTAILFFFSIYANDNILEYKYFLIASLLISIISFIDDFKTLSPIIRIVSQFIAVTLIFYSLNIFSEVTPFKITIMIISYIFSIGFINIYNFMDGINGMTFLNALLTFVTLTAINYYIIEFTDSDLLVVLIIATLVFGYFNFRKEAKCFAGDVGSITIGFTVFYFLLKYFLITHNFTILLLISVYLLDGGWTIIQRFFNKENIFKAHKKHLYQTLVNERKFSHLKVSTYYFMAQLIINIFALSLLYYKVENTLLITIATLIVLSGIYFFIIKRVEKSLSKSNLGSFNKNKIWLSSPHMGGNEQKYIKEAFDANWIAPLGSNVSGFEQDLEKYLGENSKVAALSSGTAAIHLALILANVQRDDDVICQSMTFSASANPILYLGANPIFIDSEKDTWNMCPNHLEKKIKERIEKDKKPKAIIVVHLYGMPAMMDEIVAISKKFKITLIEDAAESLGSTYKGQKCGTFGDYGILSFNGNKIITTSGGGALVCKNQIDKDKAIFYATQSRDEAPHYQHSEIGYNYRMSNIVAGIGRGQMEVLDEHVQLRRDNNKFYQDVFKNIDGVQVFVEPSNDFYSNHWLSCITIDTNLTTVDNEKLKDILFEENIEARPLWKPMHLQPIFEKYDYLGSKISESLFLNGLCLPSGSNLLPEEKERIIKAILKGFRE
ncbi:MAG: hypothetical protein COA67_03685 [Lutibacter sp.]|nr:MAG: hypothetical protein COA67_03685 [Lutibacter sp.]